MSRERQNTVPSTVCELSDTSRQQPSRARPSLTKRVSGKIRRSLQDTKLRISDHGKNLVLAYLTTRREGINAKDLGAISSKPLSVPAPITTQSLRSCESDETDATLVFAQERAEIEKLLSICIHPRDDASDASEMLPPEKGALEDTEEEPQEPLAKATTFTEQLRGMLAFQDPSVMSDAGDPWNALSHLTLSRKATDSHPREENEHTVSGRRAIIARRAKSKSLVSGTEHEGTAAPEWLGCYGLHENASTTGTLDRTESSSSHISRSETSLSGPRSLATSMEEGVSASSASASDNEDGASDVTDYTDLSLIETFERASVPLNRALLAALVSIKDDIVAEIVRVVQLTTLPTQGARQHTSGDAQGSQSAPRNSETSSPTHPPSNIRKRSLNSDEQGDDTHDGDDDKERRTHKETTLALVNAGVTKKFACPFYKRHPGSFSLPKSCHGPGWQSVHRVKEHIYRRHQRPMHRCTRCLVSFDEESMLVQHIRAEERCENHSSYLEEEVLYVTQTQERALRKRHRNLPEEERWARVFQIIFPEIPVDQMPTPYYELEPGDYTPSAATLDEFRAFVVQELPSRIMDDVNNHLRLLPGVTIAGDQMTSILRDTIQEVMERFLHAPASQNGPKMIGLAGEVSSRDNTRVTPTLNEGNVLTIPLQPIGLGAMCQPSWFSHMSTLDFWDPNLFVDPSEVMLQDPGLVPSFVMDDRPKVSEHKTEPSLSIPIRHGETQEGRNPGGLTGFPDSVDYFSFAR